MTVHLPDRWIEWLCDLPESGMGYQNVVVRLRDGSTWTVIVYNAEEFELPPDGPLIDPSDIVDIRLASEQRVDGDPR